MLEKILATLKKACNLFVKIWIVYILVNVLFTIVIFSVASCVDWYRSKTISDEGIVELQNLLEITDAPSFKFIHKKLYYSHDKIQSLEVKFKISKEDYEKNELNYGPSYEDVLIDCKYIEKEKNGIYTCVVRKSNEHNDEFFKKLSKIH